MSEHSVVIYVNDARRTFTATARKASSRLPEVTDWCKKHGFTPQTIAQNISKKQADRLKAAQIAAYEAKGYAYETRPAL